MIRSVNSVCTVLPGLTASVCVALAAAYLAEHYGAPAILLVLLLGTTFHYLCDLPATAPGVECSAKTVLRIGVALLGARITYAEVAALGPTTAAFVVAVAGLAIAGGYVIGRAAKLPGELAILSAGAVAICGASAALAIASVLPKHDGLEQKTIVTVAGITTLSTVAMMLYPVIAAAAHLDHREAGIFIGATVHDVAQVVGAAFMVSPETGETATIVKLLRVACLLPALVGIGWMFRSLRLSAASVSAAVPWFLVAFVALVTAGSVGLIPPPARQLLTAGSEWCLLVAVAALGMRTSIRHLASLGPAVFVTLFMQSLLLVVLVLTGLFAS